MSRKRTAQAPEDDEILKHNNVPFPLAASYLGWSTESLRRALQQQRAPIGMAAQNPETGSWSYNISPGALIAYKHGELEMYSLRDLVDMISGAVQRELDTRLAASRSALMQIIGGQDG